MNKNLLFVSFGQMPYNSGNGNAVLMDGIIECLMKVGFNVHILILFSSEDNEISKVKEEYLQKLGCKVVVYERDLIPINSDKSGFSYYQLLFPSNEMYFEDKYITIQLIQNYITENGIDLVYGYNWNCLGLLTKLRNVKTIVSLVDLLEDFHSRRKEILLSPLTLRERLKRFVYNRLDTKKVQWGYKYLRTVDYIIEHAYQHKIELLERGYKNIMYIPHPLKSQETKFLKRVDVNEDCYEILILGSMKGVASILGYKYFFEELYPELDKLRLQLQKPLRFRLVGHGQPNDYIIKNSSEHKNMKFVGYVENLQDEYANTDLMLVNVPISHGFRTRIAEAFSFGLFVAAHKANAEGMPELKDDFNCALGEEPSEFAQKIVQYLNNSSARYTIAREAIDTFERSISQNSAMSKFTRLLEESNIF